MKTQNFFEARCDMLLENFSLQTGEIFEVLDDELSGHFKIRTQCGQIGFISPTNFRCSFSLSKTGWYLPNVSRKQAAEMLSDKNRPVGSFLVRNSEHKGDSTHVKTLTVKSRHLSLRNYRIYHEEHYYINESRLFDTLTELVNYYVENGDHFDLFLNPLEKSSEISRLDENEIVKKDKIGSGHFGEVHIASLDRDHLVALKSLKTNASKENKEEFYREAELVSSLSHTNIVSIVGVTGDPTEQIVFEFMQKGSLQNYLRENSDLISLRDQIHWSHDLISALLYLSTLNIVHRDIAARNVLLSSKKIAKLADFGMAIKLEEDEYYFQLDGPEKLPVRWLSPEASAKWKFSLMSDIWAFGVAIWEICSLGERPYKDLHNRDIQKAVKEGRRLKSENFGCKQSNKSSKKFYSRMYELLKKCWEKDEDKRPSASEVYAKIEKLFNSFL